MKVILLEDVENVGKKYEVKEVKDGHARNLLIPNKLVKIASRENMKWLKAQKELVEAAAGDELKKAQEVASRIDGLEVPMPMKVGDSGQLFESITAVKISEQLKKMGFEVKKSQIKLADPIKEFGDFPIKVMLEHNLEAEIRVMISEQKEAKEDQDV